MVPEKVPELRPAQLKLELFLRRTQMELVCFTIEPCAQCSPTFSTEKTMTLAHSLGFPRIGRDRQLKKALEAFWQGTLTEAQLRETGRTLRAEHWQIGRASCRERVADSGRTAA